MATRAAFLKLFLYLIVILKYPIFKNDQQTDKIFEYFKRDAEVCPACFESQWERCRFILRNVTFGVNLIDSLINIFGVKQVMQAKMNNTKNVVIKHSGAKERHNYVRQVLRERRGLKAWRSAFFNSSRVDGFHFCPDDSIDSFVSLFTETRSPEEVWTHFLVDIQVLLLPLLNSFELPVPTYYDACGFTIFESYEGAPLSRYLGSSFITRLEIAKQLLEAAFKFTEGFDGYSIYMTDVTADNVMYNEETRSISFVDLDDIIVVDSYAGSKRPSRSARLPNTWSLTQTHEKFDCDGCFAFSIEDICSYHKSDFNIFVVCQFLTEDLYENNDKGFLHSIPDKYSTIKHVLTECFSSKSRSVSRFESGERLLKAMENVLYN